MQHSFVFIVKKRIKDVLEIFGSIEKKNEIQSNDFFGVDVCPMKPIREKKVKRKTRMWLCKKWGIDLLFTFIYQIDPPANRAIEATLRLVHPNFDAND